MQMNAVTPSVRRAFAFCGLAVAFVRGQPQCFLVGLARTRALLPARAADWPTSRGNPNHTGNLDDQPGPAAPKVRWVYKAPENFIASPVPAGKALYASGLGAFNTAAFHALALDAGAPDRALWSKTAPFIKLPTVSAPAVVDGLVVFGDGMHQTDGATLYCLRADTGRPVWQYELPGKLVHLEGARRSTPAGSTSAAATRASSASI